MHSFNALFLALLVEPVLSLAAKSNSTFYNPMLPGWHSDPSCIFVPEYNNTFFCTTSSFLTFPGCPVYASKDLMNWRLASFAHNRESQFPGIGTTISPEAGYWASTIRYRNGTFYLITEYSSTIPFNGVGVLFKTTNPFNNSAWSDPVTVRGIKGIDPDLFWDDDGQSYIASGCISLQTINLETGAVGPIHQVWNGSGAATKEGPHIYKKDGEYYGICAEGGTGMNHKMTVSRSSTLIPTSGLYESYSHNPVLTAIGSSDIFQTVGHGDLFQDQYGQWWGVALTTRCGPERFDYPMGRETGLYPVTWPAKGWPTMSQIHGMMSGWPLAPLTKDVAGEGPFLEEPDNFTFPTGSALPGHFRYWRFPTVNGFTVSPPGHPNTLQINPSKLGLSGGSSSEPRLSLILRVQTDTKYTYSIDVVNLDAKAEEAEVGATAFCSNTQHFDLGLVLLPLSNGTLAWNIRFRTTAKPPVSVIKAVPSSWLNGPIRLIVEAISNAEYRFSAASAQNPKNTLLVLGTAPSSVFDAGDCRYTGAMVGAYATTNGGDTSNATPAYVTNWMYAGNGQEIGGTDTNPTYVPSTPY